MHPSFDKPAGVGFQELCETYLAEVVVRLNYTHVSSFLKLTMVSSNRPTVSVVERRKAKGVIFLITQHNDMRESPHCVDTTFDHYYNMIRQTPDTSNENKRITSHFSASDNMLSLTSNHHKIQFDNGAFVYLQLVVWSASLGDFLIGWESVSIRSYGEVV
jgi:hypothetical protein